MSLITTLRDDLLGLAGHENPQHAPKSVLERILSDINAVGQRLATDAPSDWWTMQDGGQRIYAPTALTGLTLTQNSKVISGAGLQSWMHGCCVQLAGETPQNYLIQTGANSWQLLTPYDGASTGSGTGTVYHDAINLDETSVTIERPMIENEWELTPLDDKAQLRWNYYTSPPLGHYRGDHAAQSGYPMPAWNREVGTPASYLLEQNPAYDGRVTVRIRLHPLPDAIYKLTYRQRLTFTPVTSFADNRTQIVPHRYHDLIFLPLVRKKFSAHSSFTGNLQLTLNDAREAESKLEALCRPQRHKDNIINMEGGW